MELENGKRKEGKDRIFEGSSARDIFHTKLQIAHLKNVFSIPVCLTTFHASFHICAYNLPKSDSSALKFKFFVHGFILMSPNV
jgi:hypothetical protein